MALTDHIPFTRSAHRDATRAPAAPASVSRASSDRELKHAIHAFIKGR